MAFVFGLISCKHNRSSSQMAKIQESLLIASKAGRAVTPAQPLPGSAIVPRLGFRGASRSRITMVMVVGWPSPLVLKSSAALFSVGRAHPAPKPIC